jgi:anti-sigma regulatory factor (Ser/Thr protein kinase)
MNGRPSQDTSEFDAPRGVIAARPGMQREAAGLQAAARLRVRDRARMSRLRLRLSASADEVPFARAAITRLCEHLEIEDEQTERIRLAVTEACSNCVLHAYGDCSDTCTYVLDARVDQQALRVTVCDAGVGIHNAPANTRPSLGRGLHLIQSLADSAQVASRPSGGTRVVMLFAMSA